MIANIVMVKKIRILLNMEGFSEKKINDDVKITLYRIIQEQLTNILKHADAGSVHIELSKEGNQIALEITDNGKGFDTTLHRKGVGITNITSRASLFDGEVKITSAPGKGSHLKVTLQTKK
jgi:signal transduction histidine kinase